MLLLLERDISLMLDFRGTLTWPRRIATAHLIGHFLVRKRTD